MKSVFLKRNFFFCKRVFLLEGSVFKRNYLKPAIFCKTIISGGQCPRASRNPSTSTFGQGENQYDKVELLRKQDHSKEITQNIYMI